MRLAPLFGVILLDLIGFGIVMPILPFYAEAYGAHATMLGFLLAIYAAMQFVFAPLWGRLSDRIGRRPVLLLTVAAGGGSLLVLGMAHSLLWIFIGRTLAGIFAANISVATAYVSDVTDEQHRTSGMGMIGAAFGIGFILGPALGGFLAPYGYHVPILIAAGLNGLNLLQIFWRLPEPKRHEPAADKGPRVSVLCDPTIRHYVLLNCFFIIGITQFEAVFAFLMMDRFGYDAHQVAYLLVFTAVIMALVQGGLIRRLKGVADRQLLVIGAIGFAAAMLLLPAMAALTGLLLVLAACAIGRGLSQPALLSLVSKVANPAQRGVVLGTFQSAGSLGRVIAPVIAGVLYDWQHVAPFFFGGGCVTMVVVSTVIWKRIY